MKEAIINYIVNDLIYDEELDAIKDTDNLLEQGLIDSIKLIKIVNFIETEFEFKVKPEDMIIENFESVNAIVNYINTTHE
jgi:acyl carrier protein